MPGHEWKKSVKNPKMYEALRKKGLPKSHAAQISNARGNAAESEAFMLEHELDLLAAPTIEIPNVGHIGLSELTNGEATRVRELQSAAQRKKWVKEGKAMPDGGYPIPNISHLKKAVQAYGRAKDKAKVKRWVIRRARALKRTDLLPESWGVASTVNAKTAAATSQHDGVIVAVFPPPEVANALAGTTEGDEPANELHVTLAYLGTTEDLNPEQIELAKRTVASVATHYRPLEAQVQGTGSFAAPESDDPRWYSVDAVGLADLRTEVVHALEDVGVQPRTDHDFTPHLTIRYGGDELSGVPSGAVDAWPVDAVIFADGGERDVYPLGHHPMLVDGETICELCGHADDDDRHALADVPEWLDDTVRVGQLALDVAEGEFVKAPGPCDLNRSPKYNWVERAGGLPNYICQVARAVARGGRSLDSAIPIAISQIRKWAAGGDDVSAGVRARAGQAIAQWDRMVAANSVSDVTLAADDDLTTNADAPFTISVTDLEEGRTMPAAAIASAQWSDEYEFFWNPETDEVFRLDTEGHVETFAPNDTDDPDDTAPVWRQVEVERIRELPTVDDPDTLETIAAAAFEDGKTAAEELPEDAGRRFRIPLVVPEGVPSGDKRTFARDALEFKDPPIPVLWQRETNEGHKGSVTVGKITSIERTDAGLGNAEGVFDTHEDALEAARQVREKFLTGVSGDVDQFEAELAENEDGDEELEIKHGRLVAATLVAKPAFQEATIEFVREEGEDEVIVASAGPLYPPKEWFDDPKLSKPTHLTVDDDGRVYGHIATWGTSHLGNPTLKPPKSPSGYRSFCTNALKTAEGSHVNVGQLTLVGGHADLHMDAQAALAHYDDTKSAVADVTAGEDKFGIWVAGSVRSDVTEEQLRAFRASDPSGDWRTVDGKLDLVAVCQVNTPGFPVPRSLVAHGAPLALVAAGVAELRRDDEKPLLEARVAALEARWQEYDERQRLTRQTEYRSAIEALRD